MTLPGGAEVAVAALAVVAAAATGALGQGPRTRRAGGSGPRTTSRRNGPSVPLGRRRPGTRAAARGRAGPGAAAPRRPDHRRPPDARWADRAELRRLLVDDHQPGRLTLGAVLEPRRRRRALLATERAQSLAVIGPTQSGKTTGLAVPAILAWEGPVLAASVKADLLAATVGWRRRCGRVWCFDPTGATGLPASSWSPLSAARTWPGARRVAADLTEVAQAAGTTADGEFWYATAAKLLAPLLFAAATAGATMHDVLRWVDTQEVDEVLDTLLAAGVDEAVRAARATWQRDDRQRSAVYTTAETVLEPYAGLAPDRHRDEVDPLRLVTGTHSLYLCAPAHDQRRLRGLFVALVKQVVEAAFERALRTGRPLQPPLLVVLDEAANIAPLAELDGLAATCAGHGVQLVTVWQDLSQVRARYGERAPTVVNNHRAKLFLSGASDPATLDHASHLVGEEEVVTSSVSRSAWGDLTVTSAPQHRRLLPPDALRRLPPGTGVLVYGSLPPVRMALRPWFDDPGLAARARGPSAGGRGGRSRRPHDRDPAPDLSRRRTRRPRRRGGNGL